MIPLCKIQCPSYQTSTDLPRREYFRFYVLTETIFQRFHGYVGVLVLRVQNRGAPSSFLSGGSDIFISFYFLIVITSYKKSYCIVYRIAKFIMLRFQWGRESGPESPLGYAPGYKYKMGNFNECNMLKYVLGTRIREKRIYKNRNNQPPLKTKVDHSFGLDAGSEGAVKVLN